MKAPVAEIAARFGLDEAVKLSPRYNIAPGTDISAVRVSPEGKRVMHLLRWGLVPHWAKDTTIGAKLSNARGETVAVKPSFRDAFQRRRCLVPADGFYEWKTVAGKKQPYYFSMKDGAPFALGGLWKSWKGPYDEIIRTCCLITTGPNEVMEPVHDRMPVIVSPVDYSTWLSSDADTALDLVKPYPADAMQIWAVDRRVSRSVEEGAGLIEPLANGPPLKPTALLPW